LQTTLTNHSVLSYLKGKTLTETNQLLLQKISNLILDSFLTITINNNYYQHIQKNNNDFQKTISSNIFYQPIVGPPIDELFTIKNALVMDIAIPTFFNHYLQQFNCENGLIIALFDCSLEIPEFTNDMMLNINFNDSNNCINNSNNNNKNNNNNNNNNNQFYCKKISWILTKIAVILNKSNCCSLVNNKISKAFWVSFISATSSTLSIVNIPWLIKL
jgi:hypothetical protein